LPECLLPGVESTSCIPLVSPSGSMPAVRSSGMRCHFLPRLCVRENAKLPAALIDPAGFSLQDKQAVPGSCADCLKSFPRGESQNLTIIKKLHQRFAIDGEVLNLEGATLKSRDSSQIFREPLAIRRGEIPVTFGKRGGLAKRHDGHLIWKAAGHNVFSAV